MINGAQHPTAWQLMIKEINDLVFHLQQLSTQMQEQRHLDESDYQAQLAHAYAHLNRAWNGRYEITEESRVAKREPLSRMPTDIEPLI